MYKKTPYPQNIIDALCKMDNRNRFHFDKITNPETLIERCIQQGLSETSQHYIERYYKQHKTYKQIGAEESISKNCAGYRVKNSLYELENLAAHLYPENIIGDICNLQADKHCFDNIDNLVDIIECCIEKLSEREQHVITKFYKEHQTYQTIGNEFGVTRERIRQIAVKAVRKLNQYVSEICCYEKSKSDEHQKAGD